MIKESFQMYFDGMEVYSVVPIPIKTNYYLPMSDLILLSQITSLESYSLEFIMNLFTFEEGIQVLLRCRNDLIQNGTIMYLFSSPLVPEQVLLELLDDNDIIRYANDNWLEHLYANPNIQERSIYDLDNLHL